ncbi:MAG: universal stress protein [Acidobacteriota bacterium]
MREPGANRWVHPSVVLVATDLTDLDRLMPFALDQGTQTGARLILLHVISGAESLTADVTGMPYYDPAGALEIAARELELRCSIARGHGLLCDSLVREGNAAQQILSAARQFHVDRILLGTRSRGRISKLFLGSVAEQVLRSVNLPVITVGPEAHREVSDSTPERVVLHATTLSEASRPSAALACQTAALLHARLVLLHVLPHLDEIHRMALPAGLDCAAIQQMNDMARAMACTGFPIEPRVVHGNPAIEILATASELKASLIVLAATNKSTFETLTRDGTVYKVLAHARCPVLSLREPATSEDAWTLAHEVLHS